MLCLQGAVVEERHLLKYPQRSACSAGFQAPRMICECSSYLDSIRTWLTMSVQFALDQLATNPDSADTSAAAGQWYLKIQPVFSRLHAEQPSPIQMRASPAMSNLSWMSPCS